VLDQKWDRAIGGAEGEHADHAQNEIGPNIGLQITQESNVILHSRTAFFSA
jgi:hypothetical protein